MRMRALLPLVLLSAPALAAGQAVCATPIVPGREQSPVDITHPVATQLAPLGTRYPRVGGVAVNTGSTVKVYVSEGDSITVNGERFGLVEFHFHWPAEHELSGDTFPVEIHMVHRSATGRLAVLGTWVRRGETNHAWDALWRHLPTGSDSVRIAVDVPHMFSIANLNAERVYRYCGSLTTGEREPYTEGVTWLMRRTSIPMSPAQMIELRRVMGRYSRGVQPLYGRVIRYRPTS
jgi:carbonic anhydrase